tara:strand:+ start:5103 stop:5480 length:378 start_codon:yes stop_codon:yes gene_type:complete
MIVITLNNIKNLNTSLQVGDMIYATSTTQQVGGVTDFENQATGINKLVGILRRITTTGSDVVLDVDDSLFVNPYTPEENDFLMFSKYSQTDGDVNGYYAETTFKNNSKVKAELFSVGSEVIINSK